MGGDGTVTAQIMKYFTDAPGSAIYLDDIVNDSGLPVAQVKKTIQNIRQAGRYAQTNGRYHPGSDLVDVIRGNAWSYKPNTPKATVIKPVSNPTVKNFPRLGSTVPVEEESPRDASSVIARPVGKTFEVVGKTTDGTTIVKDERDKLFRVMPL